jgi:hypothetical protein
MTWQRHIVRTIGLRPRAAAGAVFGMIDAAEETVAHAHKEPLISFGWRHRIPRVQAQEFALAGSFRNQRCGG